MAQSVVRYLVLNHDVPVYRIYTVGMGNVPIQTTDGAKQTRTRGGRVEISLLKNGLGDLASASPANGTPAQEPAAPASPASTTNPQQPNSNKPPQ